MVTERVHISVDDLICLTGEDNCVGLVNVEELVSQVVHEISGVVDDADKDGKALPAQPALGAGEALSVLGNAVHVLEQQELYSSALCTAMLGAQREIRAEDVSLLQKTRTIDWFVPDSV